MDIAEKLATEYYQDDTIEKINSIRSMLAIPGVHFYISPDEVIWVYLLLSDEGLDLLRSKTKMEDFTPEFSRELLDYPGKHIYVFRSLAPENISQRSAFRKASVVLMGKHRAPDISWHDNKRVFLHTYRG